MLHLVLISLWNAAAGTEGAGETETERWPRILSPLLAGDLWAPF